MKLPSLRLPFGLAKSTHDGWLAAVLGEATGRFAHVKPGTRPQVALLEERTWSAKEPRGRERLAKTMRLRGYRCTTLLAQADYQMLLTEAPNLTGDELKAAMRWKIKDMIDYSPEEATIDVLEIPAEAQAPGRPPNVYVVASRSQTVRSVMERFRAAGMALEVIDIPEMAQRNVAALFEEPGRALLTLSFGNDGGMITVSSGGELYASRRLELTDAHLNAPEEARTRAYDRVLVEVQRSLDHFERSFVNLAVSRVLIAPMEAVDTLVAHLAANLYLPVGSMDLSQVMDLPASYATAQPGERGAWFRLIGAGLRDAGAAA